MRFAAAAACLVATGAAAADLQLDTRLFVARENLDHGYQDWREEGVEIGARDAAGRFGYVRLRRTERYDLVDREAALGAVVPLASSFTLALEGTKSVDGFVLPGHAIGATLARALPGGWGIAGTARSTSYETSRVTMLSAVLERYVGAWRLAYTGYLSRPDAEAWGSTHRLGASWYGEGLTRAEVGYAQGREIENTPAGLITSRVRTAYLVASYGLTPGWAITLDLEHVRQGDLYTRETIRLGSRLLY
jgi:YaiO family outer membrane protein